jgi:hypothetical protein
MCNRAEFGADTNPIDADSCLRFDPPARGLDGVVLSWRGGVRARQLLETTEQPVPAAGDWQVIWTNEPPTPVTNTLSPSLPGNRRYYRLRIE